MAIYMWACNKKIKTFYICDPVSFMLHLYIDHICDIYGTFMFRFTWVNVFHLAMQKKKRVKDKNKKLIFTETPISKKINDQKKTSLHLQKNISGRNRENKF